MLKNLTLKNIIGLLPLVYLIHNLEEGITMNNFLIENPSTFTVLFKPWISTWFWQNFGSIRTMALIIATILPISVIPAFRLMSQRKNFALFLLFVGWVTLLNATQHIGQTLIFRTYTPGVVSALFLNLPVGFLFISHLYKEQIWLKERKSRWFILSLLVYIPVILFIWALAALCIWIVF
jgi:hypothetical protein